MGNRIAESAAQPVAPELLETILRHAREGIVVFDAGGVIVYANEQAARLIGSTSPHELADTPADETRSRFDLFDAAGCPARAGRASESPCARG